MYQQTNFSLIYPKIIHELVFTFISSDKVSKTERQVMNYLKLNAPLPLIVKFDGDTGYYDCII